MMGPIFCETRPETIIRSAWRGDARNTSEPKRAISYSGAVAVIISIAQHANPMVSGQTLELWPSVRLRRACPARTIDQGSSPLKAASSPNVGVSDPQDDDKNHHLEQAENAQLVHPDGPWIKGSRLDVEDHEQH